MQGGKQPTAEQKRWHDFVAGMGCVITGQPASIHHCVGTTARHNKVHIGQWWVIPLSYEAHQGKHGIHGDRKLFNRKWGESRKEIEKNIFQWITVEAPGWFLSDEVYQAIMSYHR